MTQSSEIFLCIPYMTENVYVFVSHSLSHTVLARCLVILGEDKCTSNEDYCMYVLVFFLVTHLFTLCFDCQRCQYLVPYSVV